jgi:hypothetical protein
MGCGKSMAAANEHAYESRCEKYGEKVVYKNFNPDCYGLHARNLENRERGLPERTEKQERISRLEYELKMNAQKRKEIKQELAVVRSS